MAGRSSNQSGAAMMKGPPYPPKMASLGNPPSPIPDVPASAVFMVLFFVTGIFHVKTFIANKRRGHKFPFSMALTAFCLIRTLSGALRVGWSYHLTNINLAIAAQIFVAAGTIVLFIINIFFAERLMRARHPHIGWSKPFSICFPPLAVLFTILSLVMVITSVIQSFFTLNPNTHRIDRDIQLAATTYFAACAFFPIPIVLTMLAIPRRHYIDKFGAGRFRTKVIILLTTSTFLSLGAGFRAGTSYVPPVPQTAHPWYFHKACFYIFDFTIEYCVTLAYLVLRVDKRFYIPDGAKHAGDFSGLDVFSENKFFPDEEQGSANNGENRPATGGSSDSDRPRRSIPPAYEANHDDAAEAQRVKQSFDDSHSVTSTKLGINEKTGKYEMEPAVIRD